MLLPPGDEAVYQQPPLIRILNKEKLESKKKKKAKKTAELDTLHYDQKINTCSEKISTPCSRGKDKLMIKKQLFFKS